MSKQVIIMLGPPGAGKGTQAAQISKTLAIPHISTGDLFRENIRNQTPLGLKAQIYMDAGKLGPDSLALDMLYERLSEADCQQGYILDGVPRTLEQAEDLSAFFANHEISPIILSIEVPEQVLIERLSNRWTCSKCSTPFHTLYSPPKVEGICDKCGGKLVQRPDDQVAVIKTRMAVYHKQTEPLLAYYKSQVISLDGTVSPEELQRKIETLLKEE